MRDRTRRIWHLNEKARQRKHANGLLTKVTTMMDPKTTQVNQEIGDEALRLITHLFKSDDNVEILLVPEKGLGDASPTYVRPSDKWSQD